MKAQRLRFRFRVTPAGATLGSRDVGNAWVDALAAAGLVVARSGKRATAQVSVAAPIPQGATSEWELIDVHLEKPANPASVLCGIAKHLPSGIEAVDVREIGPGEPSLQSSLRWAEYDVSIPAEVSREDVLSAIVAFIAAGSVPMEHAREKKVKRYDIRPLVYDLRLSGSDDRAHRLHLRLCAEPERTARVDQTLLALRLPEPLSVHRTRLFVDEIPSVSAAFRRAREREGA